MLSISVSFDRERAPHAHKMLCVQRYNRSKVQHSPLHIGALPLDTTHTQNANKYAQPIVLQWLCATYCKVQYKFSNTHVQKNYSVKEGSIFMGDLT